MTTIAAVPAEPADDSPSGGTKELLVGAATSFVAGLCANEHGASEALQRARAAHAQRCRAETELANAKARTHATAETVTALETHEDRRAHTIPFALGAGLLVILAVADAVPLYWGAESFGQGAMTTMVLCGILLVATVAGMWYLERRSHRGIVLGAFVVAYLLLSALRAHYLIVVDGASPLGALAEAGGLSAISALLLGFGSSILARTQRPGHATARREHHRATQDVARATTALERAKRDEAHATEAFRHEVERVAFASEAPAGVDHRTWLAAVEAAGRELVEKGGAS